MGKKIAKQEISREDGKSIQFDWENTPKTNPVL